MVRARGAKSCGSGYSWALGDHATRFRLFPLERPGIGTTIDQEGGSSDVAPRLGGQQQGGTHHLIGISPPTEGCHPGKFPLFFLAKEAHGQIG